MALAPQNRRAKPESQSALEWGFGTHIVGCSCSGILGAVLVLLMQKYCKIAIDYWDIFHDARLASGNCMLCLRKLHAHSHGHLKSRNDVARVHWKKTGMESQSVVEVTKFCAHIQAETHSKTPPPPPE